MADIATSAGAPEGAKSGEGLRSKARVVAHDHRTHDAPIEAPEGGRFLSHFFAPVPPLLLTFLTPCLTFLRLR